jgi:non-heme chloroperoxidase
MAGPEPKSITFVGPGSLYGSGRMKVILLHGWDGSLSYWRELVSHLNLEGLQIIAPSYRGHGDSGQPATGYTLDQFAKDP